MTILIVDDEKLLREKIRGVLESSSLSIDKLYLAENAAFEKAGKTFTFLSQTQARA